MGGRPDPLRRPFWNRPRGLCLVLLVFGKNPIKAYADIFSNTLGSAYGFSESW